MSMAHIFYRKSARLSTRGTYSQIPNAGATLSRGTKAYLLLFILTECFLFGDTDDDQYKNNIASEEACEM
jgi:hypothetical protein